MIQPTAGSATPTPVPAGPVGARPTAAAGVPLRVLGAEPRLLRASVLGFAASVPWCCVVPAGLASLGVASSLLGHWIRAAMPALFVLSAGFLGRAHYLLWVRRHGAPAAKIATLLLTALAAWLWTLRLAPGVRALLGGATP